MSCGSGAPPTDATGIVTPVRTCEIQSKRIALICMLTEFRSDTVRRCGAEFSSTNTSHFASERSVSLPTSLSLFPHMSSSSSIVSMCSAVARAHAPSSPISLSRRESRLSFIPEPKAAAMSCAPLSPMPLLPRQSSPRELFGGSTRARATAHPPRSPRPSPLSSSSSHSGGARRHSRRPAAPQVLHMRARSRKDGSQSITLCRISLGTSSSCSPAGGRGARPAAPRIATVPQPGPVAASFRKIPSRRDTGCSVRGKNCGASQHHPGRKLSSLGELRHVVPVTGGPLVSGPRIMTVARPWRACWPCHGP
mmetsp:Transcript_115779/g.328103  ORF Transcript_115779/g.328103 Transcript_115779/m.328103 type:complete len:308 (-) Transcript_115779:246-1169(-)